MSHDEAINIVVRAGKDGQKELLKALLQEMKTDDLEGILEDHGYRCDE